MRKRKTVYTIFISEKDYFGKKYIRKTLKQTIKLENNNLDKYIRIEYFRFYGNKGIKYKRLLFEPINKEG